MKLCIITVTRNGDKIAYKIKLKYKDAVVFSKYKDNIFKLYESSKEAFLNYEGIIFITSTGIAVRAIAPYIKSKNEDPAVVCIDNSCNFVISLLSGHIGNANNLALELSKLLNAEPVITTATDNMRITAPDVVAKNNGLVIDCLKDAKTISALLVDEKNVYFCDEKENIKTPQGYSDKFLNCSGIVYVTHKIKSDYDDKINCYKLKKLKLIRKDIVLGIGCRKNYDADIMKETVLMVLEKYNLDYRAVKSIGTIDVKKDEAAIISLKEFFNCDLHIFSKEMIKKIQIDFEGSDFVEKTIGVRCVAQPCVKLQNAKLITDKLKLNKMTLCIGILER